MGKPYQLELDSLAATYEHSLRLDVSAVERFLADFRSHPLIAVGSGGSFTAAHLAAYLHERFARALARPATPLDAVEAVGHSRDTAVLLLSAGGSNPDVTGAFGLLAEAEPAKLAVLCGQPNSPLTKRIASYPYVDSFAFELTSGRDGFLATNSLLTFAVVLLRAYLTVGSVPRSIPRKLGHLLHPRRTSDQFLRELSERCSALWSRPTLVVLFGPDTSSAAIDLESKFTEAALGTVQLADFRNFGHGRHHWLAKHGDESAVLALATARDHNVASRTLDLLPSSIPRVLLTIPGSDVEASVAAIVTAFYVAGLAGNARGIDPGRPGVPAFGRRIYNLRTFHLRPQPLDRLPKAQVAAIERKTGSSVENLKSRGELNYWFQAYRQFVQRLRNARFGAIILDYDGTLCETRERAHGIRAESAAELVRLIRAGVLIGIVTGRGKSVRKDLRRELPADAWDHILVGYYNGSDIAPLRDESRPDAGKPCDSLAIIARVLSSERSLVRLCDVDSRPSQISVTPKAGVPLSSLWEALQRATSNGCTGATVVRSGHSFDVLAPGVSKTSLVERIGQNNGCVLCIGDRGQWPGNDFALLSAAFSLSSHEVSCDPATCWNLAPPGQRGVVATLYYLRSLRVVSSGARVMMRMSGHTGKG